MRRDSGTGCLLPAVSCQLIAAFLLLALPVQAQAPDPSRSATARVGPLALRPALSITNAGVDTNIFNETDDEDPKSDWTLSVGPASDFWLKLGRARLSGRAAVTYDWFATYASQRSLGTADRVRLELPLTKIRPYVGGSYLTLRDRPGYEIDVRVRHSEEGLNGGVEFPISRRTTFGVGWERTVTRFDADATFDGSWLRQVLNRRESVVTASARYKVTPLTTVTLEGEVGRERFQFSPGREANSLRVLPGVEFDALFRGTAKVGYRRLRMLRPGMPDFSGAVASVDLNYTLLGATRFTVGVTRDIEYSYWVDQPFYVLTGASFSVTQAVGGPWALVARTGLQRLAYRSVAALSVSPEPAEVPAQAKADRIDQVTLFGGGLSYKLGPSVRLGLDANYYTRSSDYDYRDYRGLRAGTSVTYGF